MMDNMWIQVSPRAMAELIEGQVCDSCAEFGLWLHHAYLRLPLCLPECSKFITTYHTISP